MARSLAPLLDTTSRLDRLWSVYAEASEEERRKLRNDILAQYAQAVQYIENILPNPAAATTDKELARVASLYEQSGKHLNEGHDETALARYQMAGDQLNKIVRDIRHMTRPSRWRRLITSFGLGAVLAGSMLTTANKPVASEEAPMASTRVTASALNDKEAERFKTTMEQSSKFMDHLEHASAKHNVPLPLLFGVAATESEGDVNAKSPKGARGLMQVMPVVAKKGYHVGAKQLLDPEINADISATELSNHLRAYEGYDAKVQFALASYNWGYGNMQNLLEKLQPNPEARKHLTWEQVAPHLNDETRLYVPRVINLSLEWHNVQIGLRQVQV